MQKNWEDRPDGEIRAWNEVYEKTRAYYSHYKAVLKGDITDPNFARKQREVAQTRKILEIGSTHRNPKTRKQGIGSQDQNVVVKPK